MPSPQWHFADFRLDPTNACLWRGADTVVLQPKAFDLLYYLVTHQDRLISKDELLDAVWPEAVVNDAALRVVISALRKALGDTAQTSRFIATVPRRGYRFLAPVRLVESPELATAGELLQPLAPAFPQREALPLVLAAPTGERQFVPLLPPVPYAETAAAPVAPLLSSSPSLVGERKQVTVLCANIPDTLVFLDALDPEVVQQLLEPALHTMMDVVQRYGGTVQQVAGDGLTALFGAPMAYEDHAIRACYAALAMQAALRTYADVVSRTHGVLLQCRIGLNAGEVVRRAIRPAPPGAYSLLGQTTHLAERLMQGALPDTILCTAVTAQLVAGLVGMKAREPMSVQGLAVPVEVYEVLGASGQRRRLQTAKARGLSHFVGRQAELAALQAALAQAETGHGQVVAVVGEAGVGKSRLLDEFVSTAEAQGWMVLDSAAVSFSTATPYFPVIDLLRRYGAVDDRDDPQIVRAKVTGQVLALHASLQDILPALLALLEVLPDDSPFLRLEPPQRRQHTLNALKRLLIRISQVQRLLLIFEDLHWIDTETQAVLSSLVESLPMAQLLLLVNYRPDYQHPWGSKTCYRQLRLDPLAPASATALLQTLVGQDVSVLPLMPVLIGRTEGNPLFLEESVRSLVETRVLVGEPGAYCLVQPLPNLPVPVTVQAVLAARIDRLPPEEKQLLQAAAVLGKDVSAALLQAIVDVPRTTVQSGLIHLQAAELLYETALFPEPAYTFKHVLTQEVAYNAVLLEQRRRLHGRAAQAIEALWTERLAEHYHTLAHHYRCSGDTSKAVDYLQRAAQQAVERSAYAEAINALRAALDLLSTLPETRERCQQEFSVQMTLGIALRATQGSGDQAVERLYTRARALCEQLGEPTQLYRVLWGFWWVYNARGDYQTMRALGEQLLNLAQGLRDPALLLEAHHALWTSLFSSGELAAARAHQEQGRLLYDPQRHRTYASLYSGHDPGVCCRYRAAPVLWLLGYPEQALASSQAALSLAQELDHPYSLTHALHWAAVLHHLRREVTLTQERAETAITIATAQGFSGESLLQANLLQGWALAACGHWEEGLAQLRQLLEASRGTRTTRDRAYHLALLAEVSVQGGQSVTGLEALAEALLTLPTSGARWWEAEVHRLRGVLLLQNAMAQPEEAEACWQQALMVARRQQAKSLELRATMSLSRLWQQQGKRTAAYALLAPIYSWFTEGFETADLREAKVLLETLT
jgi:predicted ATPase/DNA-binding winged helix-turn-helix (wHTH) protein/class 3 adenylate cyclase